MKTLLALAVSAVLVAACGGSDGDDLPSTEDAATPPDTGVSTPSNPMTPIEPDQGGDGSTPSDDPATSSPGDGSDAVTGGASDPGTGDASANPDDLPFERLLETLAAYSLDRQVMRTEIWVETARASALATRDLADGAGTEIDCALGGSLTIGRIERPPTASTYSSSVTDVYDFDACNLPENDGGEGVIDGRLSVIAEEYDAPGAGRSSLTRTWTDFAFAGADGSATDLDGTLVTSSSSTITGAEQVRTVELDRALFTVDGQPDTRLEDVSFELIEQELPLGAVFERYGLRASGSVTSGESGGVPVAIETTVPFTRLRALEGAGPSEEPFAGEMTFRAADGRSVTVSARDTESGALLVDTRTVGADGQVRTTESVELPELAFTVV